MTRPVLRFSHAMIKKSSLWMIPTPKAGRAREDLEISLGSKSDEYWLQGSSSLLKKNLGVLSSRLSSHLIAHRGFHDVSDTVARPIENTERAYATAWLELERCECDIAMTKDKHLILCHDENFSRLAHRFDDDQTGLCTKKISELTLAEVKKIRLKDGQRPAALTDVLSIARDMSANSSALRQMVVELKMGSAPDLPYVLAAHLRAHPNQLPHIAAIMSFDHSLVYRGIKAFGPMPKDRRPLFLLLCCSAKDCSKAHRKSKTVYLDLSCPASAYLLLRDGVDGLYLEYSEDMLKENLPHFRALCQRCTVGVWGSSRKGHPDSQRWVEELMDVGAHFVNTDIPIDFTANTMAATKAADGRAMAQNITGSPDSVFCFGDAYESHLASQYQ